MGCGTSHPIEPDVHQGDQQLHDRQKDTTAAKLEDDADRLVQWNEAFSKSLFEVEAKLSALAATMASTKFNSSFKRPCHAHRLPRIENPRSSEEEAVNNISTMTADMVAWVEAYHRCLKDAREAMAKVVRLTSLKQSEDNQQQEEESVNEPEVVSETTK